MFRALVLHKDDAGFRAGLESLDEARLPPLGDGDVRVAVEYSSLNYKDGLALTNKGPVVRSWPMVPGIDGAGTVLESRHARWQAGDRVVHNGWGVGETRWGCLSERAVLVGDGLVRLPAAFTARQAMAIGTAGYTAMLCVLALEQHGLRAGDGDVLVTGATGGVGSVAIALLSRLGHRVVAATGKAAEAGYLEGARCRRQSSTVSACRHPASRCRRSAGPRWSMPWAATRWPTPWRRRATAAWSRPADWRKAWTCRPAWRPSSCVA